MTSMTKELRKTVNDKDIRKNITKIYFVEGDEREDEKDYYEIYFKEETVKSVYSCEYITSTTCPADLDINEWLKEIVFIEEV